MDLLTGTEDGEPGVEPNENDIKIETVSGITTYTLTQLSKFNLAWIKNNLKAPSHINYDILCNWIAKFRKQIPKKVPETNSNEKVFKMLLEMNPQ